MPFKICCLAKGDDGGLEAGGGQGAHQKLVESTILIDNWVKQKKSTHTQWATKVPSIRSHSSSKTQIKKTHYYPWRPFVYLLEPWKQTYLVGWFLALDFVHLLFLHSLHLHHVLHMFLHKSGSQPNRVFRITVTRFEECKVHLIPC